MIGRGHRTPRPRPPLPQQREKLYTPCWVFSTNMAVCIWHRFLAFARCKNMRLRRMSIYAESHGFHEDAIKAKLSQFTGGSIDLSLNDNGIGMMTFNNPIRMNAFTGTMMVELLDRVKELEGWTVGKGLIVHGAENTFCSGSDLNAVKAISSSQEGMKMCMFMQNTLTRLSRLPLISVALVQGKALGGGAELSTACDFRLMTPGSEIQFVHKHMGLVPGWGGAARLFHIVGAQHTLRLLSTALKVDPAHALQIGLADAVLPSNDGSLEVAQEWLTQYIKGPAAVIQAIKNVTVSGREQLLESALRTEKDIFGTVWGGPANLQALSERTKHK